MDYKKLLSIANEEIERLDEELLRCRKFSLFVNRSVYIILIMCLVTLYLVVE